MRRCAVPVGLLLALVLCCTLAASAPTAFAGENVGTSFASKSAHAPLASAARPFFANEQEAAATVALAQGQQKKQQQRAPQMEFVAVPAAPAAVLLESPTAQLHQRKEPVSVLAADASSSAAAVVDTRTAAEKYGALLPGGVIASVTIAIVFACFLLVLVLIEVGTSINDFIEHRRMRAARESKTGDDPSEPKYGDFRDTAVNRQV